MSEDTVQAWEQDTTRAMLEVIQRRKTLFEVKGVVAGEAGLKAFDRFSTVLRSSTKATSKEDR